MTARQAILDAVRAARLAPVPLPDFGERAPTLPDAELLPRFLTAASAAGAEIIQTDRPGLARAVRESAPHAIRVMSEMQSVAGSVSPASDAHSLADLELFVAEAALGVAENGAVWLAPTRGGRAAAFLAEHVAVAIDRAAIVADLHEAYQRIDVAAQVFGVFVAGPSKTADIEQSLVIGAHGPKRLTVIVL